MGKIIKFMTSKAEIKLAKNQNRNSFYAAGGEYIEKKNQQNQLDYELNIADSDADKFQDYLDQNMPDPE